MSRQKALDEILLQQLQQMKVFSICDEPKAKKKRKRLEVVPRRSISNLQLDSDEGESENDEDDDLSDFDEDESDVNNDAVFEES